MERFKKSPLLRAATKRRELKVWCSEWFIHTLSESGYSFDHFSFGGHFSKLDFSLESNVQTTEHPWRLVDWTTNSQIFMMQFYEMVLAKCCTCSHEQIALTLFSEFSRRCVGCHRNPRSSPIIAASETSASFLPPTASASLSLSAHISEVDVAFGGVTGCACAVDND